MQSQFSTGSIIQYRERDWIILPYPSKEYLYLRPLNGSFKEPILINWTLQSELAKKFPIEQIHPSKFPLVHESNLGTLEETRLFIEASRLLLREGAAPFRSFGHISIRPRPYQIVPLIMALRLDPVRLLIADDVGVGKTIEAGLIARELLDRSEIQKICVLCPPYLCDQWKKELSEKFSIDAVVVRSGTISSLERQIGSDSISIFEYFDFMVVSIDLVKSEKYKDVFVQHAPNFIIVDEVHGASKISGKNQSSQQLRYELLYRLFADKKRNGVFVTATPHSGKEESFLSILGLLNPEFESYSFSNLTEKQRKEISKHFVQRRRADVKRWLNEDTPFPERDTVDSEQTYTFSKEYLKFFGDVYDYARGIVEEGQNLKGVKQRMKFWSALALLRSVSSSPAAAFASLQNKSDTLDKKNKEYFFDTEEDLNLIVSPLVEDKNEEIPQDNEPTEIMRMEEFENSNAKNQFKEFANRANSLKGKLDNKLQKLLSVLDDLLSKGFHPIVWCRYIATAEYIKQEIQSRYKKKYKDLAIGLVTGNLDDEDRKSKILELESCPSRLLVSTDCLSEGINLQKGFNAVIHYDLPWNPNRLEQREGRVDRYGQISDKVKIYLIYGKNNPVDGAVWEVLVKKARDIQKHLGVTVPVPVQSENIIDAILKSIFKHKTPDQQELFGFVEEQNSIQKLHEDWDRDVEKEKLSRTRFAQHSISPEEVEKEIKNTDKVLGNYHDVQRFILEIGQRSKQKSLFSISSKNKNKFFEIPISSMHSDLKSVIEKYNYPDNWKISFVSPEPEGTTYIGRNHPFIESLAEICLDEGVGSAEKLRVSRASIVQTDFVQKKTTLLILRARYSFQEGSNAENLLEEILSIGFTGKDNDWTFLSVSESEQLFQNAEPKANYPLENQKEMILHFQSNWNPLEKQLEKILKNRAKELKDTHLKIHKSTLDKSKVKIEWKSPVDCLAVSIYIPMPKGVKS